MDGLYDTGIKRMSLDFKKLENLIYDEAECLDNGLYDDWLDLFAEDGIYWVPRRVNQPDPFNEISLFYEDKTLLRMRVKRLQHPQNHSATMPFRISHVIGAVRVISTNDKPNEVQLSSRFHAQEYHDDRERHFSGKYTHDIVSVDGKIKIRMKRVDLVNCEAAFEPIEVPI
jgi:3-phenylpropionate/cinnamic acid dioxygenase small subunit